MLRIGLIDANEKANERYRDLAASVVAGWLRWEAEHAEIAFVEPERADIVLLAFAGALDWEAECRRYLRRHGINPDARVRRAPYVIAGGPVDAIPLTALRTADAVAVGEAYIFVREILDRVRGGASIGDIRAWIASYRHAIERSQVVDIQRDPEAPWLLAEEMDPLAEPDPWVDWSMAPAVRSDDKVVRVVASKGCHLKCGFCATTYRQAYSQNPDTEKVLSTLRSLKARGERVQLLSNDPANLPYFRQAAGMLDSQSFTILEVGKRENRDAIARSKIRISRFGVEGISERIRVAFGKAIPNAQLLEIIDDLHMRGQNTHMFFIPGAPYETEDDWSDFRGFYERVTRTVRRGICRIKFTKFLPTPPAPLARFVTDRVYEQRMLETRRWISNNAASSHVLYVAPRMGRTYTANVAEQLSISLDHAQALTAGDGGRVVDLAPTAQDARRLPWEIVRWPIAPEIRWKIGSVYRDKMARNSDVSRFSRAASARDA